MDAAGVGPAIAPGARHLGEGRKRFVASGLVMLTAFAVYVHTLCPSVYAGDSGELVLAAVTFGIPHAPGYPLFVLLGHISVMIGNLFGVVEPALMTNALSAVVASLAVAVTCAVLIRSGVRLLAAIAASLMLGLGTVFWKQALVTEVYALATLGFVASAAAVGSLELRGGRSRALLVCFLSGLLLVLHQMMILVLPAVMLTLWRRLHRRDIPAGLAVFALGLSPYLLLMGMSAADPAIDWGDPETPARLFSLMLRENYGDLAQNPISPSLVAGNLYAFFSAMVAQYPIPLALFMMPGLLWLDARRPVLNRFLGLSFLAMPVGIALLVRPSVDAVHGHQLDPFYLPAWAITAVWIACGWMWVGDHVNPAFRRGIRAAHPIARGLCRAAPLLALLAPAWLLSQNYARNDLHDFFDARVYGENIARSLPAGATLIVDGDNEAFVLAYTCRVLGDRPDIDVVHRKGFLFAAPHYLRRSRRQNLEANSRRFVAGIIASRDHVYTAPHIPPEKLAGHELQREGLVFRVTGPQDVPRRVNRTESLLRATDMSVLRRDPGTLSFMSRKFAIGYLEALWHWRRQGGRRIGAADASPDALLAGIGAIGYDFSSAQYFVAREKERAGDIEGAWRHYTRSARLDPASPFPRDAMVRVMETIDEGRD